MQQSRATTKSLTCPPLPIARYSFIQLSQLGRHWRERKCPIFETVAKGDSNPGSLDCSLAFYRWATALLCLSMSLYISLPACVDTAGEHAVVASSSWAMNVHATNKEDVTRDSHRRIDGQHYIVSHSLSHARTHSLTNICLSFTVLYTNNWICMYNISNWPNFLHICCGQI